MGAATGTGERRAVVLGGSMAGLLAARVLADAYEQVVVLERDELADAAVHRRGVPQGRHIHALLARGQEALEELFPGLTVELAGAGAPVGDMLADVRACFGGHLFARARSGLVVLSASRPLLEAHVRRRVRDLARVELREGGEAVGLHVTGDRVRGVRVRGGAERVLAADLVVDATGRGSRLPRWLEAVDRRPPAAERLEIGIRYASRSYRLPPGCLHGDLAVLDGPSPDLPRGAVLAAVEGGRHLLTLFGMLDDAPPLDPDGFRDFARSLHLPDVAAALDAAEPLGAPVPHRVPAAVRHRYERMPRFPDGLLVVGDALCSFNPVYGQGVSVAALEALALRRHLTARGRAGGRALQAAVAREAGAAWALSTGADKAVPGVTRRVGIGTRLTGAYVQRLQRGAATDPHLARAFLRVTGLVDPPSALVRPGTLLRVLGGRGGADGAPPVPAAGRAARLGGAA